MDEHDKERCNGGPWLNKTIFHILRGPIFEELFVTASQNRNDTMCGLHADDKCT